MAKHHGTICGGCAVKKKKKQGQCVAFSISLMPVPKLLLVLNDKRKVKMLLRILCGDCFGFVLFVSSI